MVHRLYYVDDTLHKIAFSRLPAEFVQARPRESAHRPLAFSANNSDTLQMNRARQHGRATSHNISLYGCRRCIAVEEPHFTLAHALLYLYINSRLQGSFPSFKQTPHRRAAPALDL